MVPLTAIDVHPDTLENAPGAMKNIPAATEKVFVTVQVPTICYSKDLDVKYGG